jgi:hypothetical protein
MHFVEKMLLFNREVRYKIHSGTGLAGSGSEMIYSGSGSCNKFRIHNTSGNYMDPFLNVSDPIDETLFLPSVFCILLAILVIFRHISNFY